MIQRRGWTRAAPTMAVVGLGLFACRPGVPGGTEESAPDGAPTSEQLANATYKGIYEETVRLQGGSWEGEPFEPEGASRPSVRLLDGPRATGDLDGDGTQEAAVLLAESSGGSGSYLYVAAVGRRNGSLLNLGTSLIGDRVQVRSMRLAEGRIELDVVQQGPEDAACCPTQKATRAWELRPDELAEVSSQVTGTVSIADLEGSEWVLTQLAWTEPAPTEPEITLVLEDGRISGSSGCNRYFAAVEEPEPTSLTLGAIGTTRMACPTEVMELEARYLTALKDVVAYGFLAGKLVLRYREDDAVSTLLFTAREAER